MVVAPAAPLPYCTAGSPPLGARCDAHANHRMWHSSRVVDPRLQVKGTVGSLVRFDIVASDGFTCVFVASAADILMMAAMQAQASYLPLVLETKPGISMLE